jgi:phenylacetate-coenzyme A ligase PaaK-like adenylate-forming protein
MRLDYLFKIPPYQLTSKEKEEIILPELISLVSHHYDNSDEYRSIINGLGLNIKAIRTFDEIPFIPVRLFKEFDLYSVAKENIIKVIKSSGTTSQISSRIYLDRETAALQQKALLHIASNFTGKERLPMLILDSPNVLRDMNSFSTRGAGILGFSTVGRSIEYALDDNMNFNEELVSNFLEKHKEQKIFLFGFTYIIWQHFYKYLLSSNKTYDFSNAVLIHGGGWKKILEEKVSVKEFNDLLNGICGIKEVYQNYGMAEQTGSIFMECSEGNLHVSNFSEVIMRRSRDFSVCEIGEKGIIQVMSLLPGSYIGHSLLTEDEGTILGEDDCKCCRKGKYFTIEGRLKSAELRGCSDTYERKSD